MTYPTLKGNLQNAVQTTVKGKGIAKYPASLSGADGVAVTINQGAATFTLDYPGLIDFSTIADPDSTYLAAHNAVLGYRRISVAAFVLAVAAAIDLEALADDIYAAGLVGDMFKATYDANNDGVVDAFLRASEAEAIAGVNDIAAITPLRLTDRLKAEGFLTPRQIGVTTGGITDQASALNSAITAMAADGGGTILIPAGERIYISSNVDLLEHVGIASFGHGTASLDIGAGPGWLDTGAGIDSDGGALRLHNGAYLKGLMIVHKDTNRAAPTTYAEAEAWTGHAVHLVGGNGGMTVKDCGIFGFDRAVNYVQGPAPGNLTFLGQTLIEGCRIDCKTGIRILNDGDVPRLLHNHCWPYLSWAGPGMTQEDAIRSGAAFQIGTGCAGAIIDGCFSFGHLYGVFCESSARVLNCGMDFWSDLAKTGEVGDGATAYLFTGQVEAPEMIACQAPAHDTGILFNPNDPTYKLSVVDCRIWSSRYGIRIADGSVNVRGGKIWGGKSGVTSVGVNISDCTDVLIDGVSMDTMDFGVYSASASYPVRIRNTDFGAVSTKVQNPYPPTVASAATLAINTVDTDYLVTGTTGISAIANAAALAGRTISLVFSGAVTLTHGTSLKLIGGANFTTAADTTMSFLSTGTGWVQIAQNLGSATLSTTGEQTLPSGLKIKWGAVASGASSGAVNFAAAFPNACLGVQLTVVGASATTGSRTAMLNGNPTASSFAWFLRQTAAGGTTGASTDVGFMWFAFGH